MMLKQKCKLLCIALIGAVCLCGCQKTSDEEKELADFSSYIAEFTSYIKDTNEKLNGLDVTKKESIDELLAILDDMDAEFMEFAKLEVPDQYKGMEQLADEASENMSLAVSYYHSAYETEEFNKADADIAYQYYERVMVRIEYIGRVLSGEEISENENITIYEESNDGNILDKWLSNDEEQTID